MKLKKKIKQLKNYIIAEIGTNHNRSKSKAIKMIYQLSKTKCDCVKFQIYEPNEIVNKKVLCKDYGLDKIYGKITAYEMFKKYLVTPKSWFPELKNICHKLNMNFAVTIHGENGINWAKKNKPDIIKIASMDHNNFPFLKKIINNVNCPILVSLGMAKFEDIIILVNILKKHKKGFGLFHCTSLYPPKLRESRMGNIIFLKDKFKIPIGFSDHFVGNTLAKKAKEYGATFFEKHVTLSQSDIGPDHKFAHKIHNFDSYISEIKKSKRKKIKNKNFFLPLSLREKKIRNKYTKSIIVKSKIPKGAKITKNKIYTARPGTGIPPLYYDIILNKAANYNLYPEQPLKWQHVKK